MGDPWAEPVSKSVSATLVARAYSPYEAPMVTASARSGVILLPWTHGESLKHNPTGRTRFVCLRSDDHGRSWQGWDEHALPFHRVSPYGTIVELADGTLRCPAHGQLDRERGYLGTCFVLRSSDRRVTWGEHSFICHDHPNGASETDMTLLQDGSLLALIRTVGFRTSGRPPRANCPRRRCTESTTLTPKTAEAPSDGSRWRYRFTLPDPNGLRYSAHHQSGEPSMCNLPDGRVMVVYYSYDESIFCGLADENCLNPLIRSEMERIPHVFKRRPCRAILTETGDAG